MIGKILLLNKLIEDYQVPLDLVHKGVYGESAKQLKSKSKKVYKGLRIVPRQIKRRGLQKTWFKNRIFRKAAYGKGLDAAATLGLLLLR